MARRVYARRYSQAVFNIALETDQLDKWQSDLGKIARLGEDDTLVALLQSPGHYPFPPYEIAGFQVKGPRPPPAFR